MTIADCVASVDQGRWEQVLNQLLTLWRASPDPSLADVIVLVGEKVRRQQTSLAQLSAEQAEAVWAGQADSDLERICEHVLADGLREARQRFAALADWPVDPRLDRWLFSTITHLAFRAISSQAFYRQVFRRLENDGCDFAELPALQEAAANFSQQMGSTMSAWLGERVEQLQSVLAPRNVSAKLAPDDLRLLEQMRARLTSDQGNTSREALLQMVFADPDSDEPRMVYADFLLEQGDPHGEFIHLQLEKHRQGLSRASLKREKELLAAHWMEFAGPLAPVVKRTTLEFERGFVSRCDVTGSKMKQEQALGSPYWATVRELGAGYEVYAQESAKSLRAVVLSTLEDVERFFTHSTPWPMETLTVVYDDEALERLGQTTLLPQLRRLILDAEYFPDRVSPQVVSQLLQAPACGRVEEALVHHTVHHGRRFSLLRSLGHRVQSLAPQVRRLSLQERSVWAAPYATLTRDADHRFTQLDLALTRDDLQMEPRLYALLQALQDEQPLQKVGYEFRGPPPKQLPAALVEALQAQGAQVTGPLWPT